MSTHDLEKLRQQLIKHEGIRLSAYQDSLGFWTIGVGRLIDARRGGGITREEAAYLLSSDINRAVRGLEARYPAWYPSLDPVRQAVLTNMAFNLGLSRLAGFRNTLALVASGEYAKAADAMLQSKWSRQVGQRAVELAQQMRSGEWA